MNPGIPVKEIASWMVYKAHSISHSLLSTSKFVCFQWVLRTLKVISRRQDKKTVLCEGVSSNVCSADFKGISCNLKVR